MRIEWENDFEIRISINNEITFIAANKEGLLSLARHLTALAHEPVGSHIHYDRYNSLEEGSSELIVERIP